MEQGVIYNLIQNGAFSLYGQPKWTFGKNTCNTYEVFAEKVHMPGGDETFAWPIVDLIEKDRKLTEAYSDWFMEAAMRSAMDLSATTGAHVTLSMNLLPFYANRSDFVERVTELLKTTALPPSKIQFELSEAQNLTEQGIQNLNQLHDQQGIALLLANFGTGYSNVNLLSDVHFDGLELDRSFAAENWAFLDPSVFSSERKRAIDSIRNVPYDILGRDIDERSIDLCKKHAKKAGVIVN